jgi:drug/metabolite transporter (DMT)-like permease
MRISGELKIVIGSALFAFIPICVLLGKDLSVASLLFGRLLVAVVILFLLQKNRKKLLNLPIKKWIQLVGWSLLMLGAMICYFLSIKYSSIAVASALLGTQPLIIVLLAVFLLKEKISVFSIIASVVTLVGILCITSVSDLTKANYLLGELLAIVSAILLGLNFIIQKKYLKEYTGQQLVFYQGLCQLPFLLPMLFIDPGTITANAVFAVILLGVVCTVLSYTLIYNGVQQVVAQKIGVLQSIEYVLPIIIGILFYGEKQSTIALLGMILIIGACLLVSLKTESKE